jgi:predicted MPP superfamily phosphohydrolase
VNPEIPFLAVVIGSTLVDAAAALAALLIDSTVIGARRLASAALLTGLVFVVKLVVLAGLGVGRFGWVHLAYIDLVVLIPAVGIVLLVSERVRADGRPWRRLTTPVRLAAVASLGLIGVGVYATFIEPFRLRLETARVVISGRREGGRDVRVGVLTDLQTNRVTGHERAAVDLLMAQRPDLILIPGDVFQGTRAQFDATAPALKDLLRRLSAQGGVFLVLGDTDKGGQHLIEILADTEIRVLVNQVARVSVGDRRVAVGGVELDYTTGWARRVVDRLEEDDDEGELRILLAHRPDVALGLRPRSRIDLVVAGHTHGGQVVVPGFGPPMTLSNVPRAVAAGGLHEIGGNPIYVSRGVGCERGQAPRIRFLCPPEVSLLEVGPP